MTSWRRQQLSGALTRAFSERQFDSSSPTLAICEELSGGGEHTIRLLATESPTTIPKTSTGFSWYCQQDNTVGVLHPAPDDFRQADIVVHVGTGSRVMRRALVHPDDETDRHLSRKSHSASPMTSSLSASTGHQTTTGRDVTQTDSIRLRTPPPSSSTSFSPSSFGENTFGT